ncbi:autotransporter outer membrane beta-barrel domain-containing protein [Yersinia aldovae]|uniref:autotransporter outer membrane beta-barrel domain-containing protein n=1 Tax=Yersinia aldovae TaxID=29483 RepID=UPI0011A95C79|nr:autotransporter outer membrane beta-barrel domain-containing protein [Yersinia aldovae]
MNKIFRIIWSAAMQSFIVTSELARKTKGKKLSLSSARDLHSKISSIFFNFYILIVLIASVFASPLHAISLTVSNYAPDDGGFETVITDNSSLSGGFNLIKPGKAGYTTVSLATAKANGWISTTTGSGPDAVDLNIFRIGDQTSTITYTDPTTGNAVTVNVYDNNKMLLTPAANFAVAVSTPVGKDGQYVDRNFYQIKSGGSLDVNVGNSGSGWVNDATNQFYAIMKGTVNNKNTTSAFYVKSDGSSGSAILNYNSKTVIRAGNNANNIKDTNSFSAAFPSDKFLGKFDSVIGQQNITNLQEFQAYNQNLIEAMKSGHIILTSEQYKNELYKAWDNSNNVIYLDTGVPADDATRAIVNRDRVSYIHADGIQSIVNISKDANIQIFSSDISLARLENGATLINNGVLGSVNGSIQGSYIVNASQNSQFINNGVLDAGTSPEMADFITSGGSVLGSNSPGENLIAILATGTSQITNNGVVNLASHGVNKANTAVLMNDTATLYNNGSINIAATKDALSSGTGVENIGILLQGAAKVSNAGDIYVGREAQRVKDDVTTDISINQPSTAVRVKSGTYSGLKGSTITLGSKVGNAVAIDAQNNNAHVIHEGTLNIQGAGSVANKASSLNVGILSQGGASDVVSSGTINLNGINAIAMQAKAGSTLENSGTININGGLDPVTRLANYGIYASGDKSIGVLSGTINLSGESGIGLHARDKGAIVVKDSGKVNFVSGNKQVGYYVYGVGSSITNQATSTQDVSTSGSVLYRVDGGATFNGSLSLATSMVASGKNSAIAQVTGKGSKFTTGIMSLDITGDAATGIRVEGGATGELTKDTVIIKVAGKDTTAGIVDGHYYDLSGNIDPTKKGDSVLTSYAALNTSNTASGAFGYIARNGGILNHKGNISFDQNGSTGVLVSGGILNNDGYITVNGVAVNIQGANSVVNNTENGTVTALDGSAAYLVGKDASLNLTGAGVTSAAGSAHGILLDNGAKGLVVDGATISMSINGSGNAIENKADISGIQLKNTTINVGNGVGVHTGASMAQTNTGIINVTGNGTGIMFENVNDGSETNNVLDMSDSKGLVINVENSGGKGIVTNASTDLKTGVSVNVKDGAGGAALIVKGSTKKVEQSGNLTSKSTIASVVDINNAHVNEFINNGNIQALDQIQKAVETTTGPGVVFTNASGGNIRGQVNLLAGNNVVTLESGSTGTDFTTGNGTDIFVLKDVRASEITLFNSINGGTGDDTLKLQNSEYILNRADAITGMEHIELTQGSTLTLDNILLALGDNQNDSNMTGYAIDSTSILSIKNNNSVDFTGHLSGLGVMTVDTSGNQFNFTPNNTSDGFTGTVGLGNTRFELSGLNTQALSNATLRADVGNITHVGSGQQTIGGLSFNGGTLKFDGVTPGVSTSSGYIHASHMDLLGRGTVQVDAGSVSNDRPLPNTTLSILEQDDGQTLIKLADSTSTVQGGAGNLILTDKDGKVISDGVVLDISQNGNSVAQGTYDYRLTGGNSDDGLYISYGLTQVELQGLGNNALVLDANGKAGNSADLSAKITGQGDLAFDSQIGQTVSLSNMDNDYTGITDLRSGRVLMLNDNVLGQTRELKLANTTVLDMNQHSQTIGTLSSDLGSLLNINGGRLILEHGGVASGQLSGDGELIVEADKLTLDGANTSLTARTTIMSGALIELNNTLGLGFGDIVNKGELLINTAKGVLYNNISDSGLVALENSQFILAGNNSQFSGTFSIDNDSQLTAGSAEHLGTAVIEDQGELILSTNSDWNFVNTVTGDGILTKLGSGTVMLNSDIAYTGNTELRQGGLVLGNASVPMTLASQQVNIYEGAKLSGFGGIAGNVNNAGILQVGTDNQTKTAGQLQTFTIDKDLVNSGMILIGTKGEAAGNQLLVKGNYNGEDGHIHFNTVLGDDNSVTDKMIITGDSIGKTGVSVSNAGGAGAQTLNGIELIHVNGASDGEFSQDGRIVAGAYDYTLGRGHGENSSNWYLTSKQNGVIPPGPNPEPGEETERPEGGSYIANLAAANNLFVTRLHDRLGETQYVDTLTGEQKVTSMWMRQVGGHNNFRDAQGQLKTQSNRYIMQLGGDIAQWSIDGLDRWHLGVMAGYGNNNSNTHSNVSGYNSKGSVDGYSTGVYGTWYANDAEKTGTYIDSWLQYSWFNNTVNGEQIASESYKSRGVSASVEVGQTFKLNEFKGSEGMANTWYIQPQAQAVWMGVKAKNHIEENGTQVNSDGDGNLMTRLGIRTYLKGHHSSDEGKGREFEPFIEANWIHNTKDFATTMNGITIKQSGTSNLGEVKVGVDGQLDPRLNLWGNIGVQVGGNGYNDAAAMIGVKYNF